MIGGHTGAIPRLLAHPHGSCAGSDGIVESVDQVVLDGHGFEQFGTVGGSGGGGALQRPGIELGRLRVRAGTCRIPTGGSRVAQDGGRVAGTERV